MIGSERLKTRAGSGYACSFHLEKPCLPITICPSVKHLNKDLARSAFLGAWQYENWRVGGLHWVALWFSQNGWPTCILTLLTTLCDGHQLLAACRVPFSRWSPVPKGREAKAQKHQEKRRKCSCWEAKLKSPNLSPSCPAVACVASFWSRLF